MEDTTRNDDASVVGFIERIHDVQELAVKTRR